MRTDWLQFVLQTTDPLFPTGAYAHSLGLEEIVRLWIVGDEATLIKFVQHQVVPGLENIDLPHLRFAYEATERSNVEELAALDRELSAWKICRELREASAQLGTRRLDTLRKIFPHEMLDRFAASESPKHHLVVYGMQMSLGRVPLNAALLSYFYQTLAALCGAALKLIRIGQEGCQRVLRDCLGNADTTVLASMSVARENAGWFNPLIEIASMRHEHAHERLFIS